eukprot:scaffold2856_cov424-Pavlova_lutheri.AAC.1
MSSKALCEIGLRTARGLLLLDLQTIVKFRPGASADVPQKECTQGHNEVILLAGRFLILQ